MNFYPHDLVKLNIVKILKQNPTFPEWVSQSLLSAPWVVVRRGEQKVGMIPVGVRGKTRSQRQALTVSEQAVITKVSPYELVHKKAWVSVDTSRKALPVFQALEAIVPIMREFEWGIGGNAGYELASGRSMANVHSDLDIIVQKFPKISDKEALKLLAELNQYGVHIDLQVVEEQNGFSLEEYANNRSQTILMKTDQGPRLVTDPWKVVTEK